MDLVEDFGVFGVLEEDLGDFRDFEDDGGFGDFGDFRDFEDDGGFGDFEDGGFGDFGDFKALTDGLGDAFGVFGDFNDLTDGLGDAFGVFGAFRDFEDDGGFGDFEDGGFGDFGDFKALTDGLGDTFGVFGASKALADGLGDAFGDFKDLEDFGFKLCSPEMLLLSSVFVLEASVGIVSIEDDMMGLLWYFMFDAAMQHDANTINANFPVAQLFLPIQLNT